MLYVWRGIITSGIWLRERIGWLKQKNSLHGRDIFFAPGRLSGFFKLFKSNKSYFFFGSSEKKQNTKVRIKVQTRVAWAAWDKTLVGRRVVLYIRVLRCPRTRPRRFRNRCRPSFWRTKNFLDVIFAMSQTASTALTRYSVTNVVKVVTPVGENCNVFELSSTEHKQKMTEEDVKKGMFF